MVDGKQRYTVNGISYVVPDTPLKLADNFNIQGIFSVDKIPAQPPAAGPVVFAASVLKFGLHDFIEIVFQNTERIMQTWHVDGYDFWVVA